MEHHRSRNSNTNNNNTRAIFSHADILETLPFQVDDMTPATKHVVYQTMQQFLIDRGITQTNFPDQEHRCPIIISLSGGVDSAVATLLLLQQGHDVTAVFMSATAFVMPTSKRWITSRKSGTITIPSSS